MELAQQGTVIPQQPAQSEPHPQFAVRSIVNGVPVKLPTYATPVQSPFAHVSVLVVKVGVIVTTQPDIEALNRARLTRATDPVNPVAAISVMFVMFWMSLTVRLTVSLLLLMIVMPPSKFSPESIVMAGAFFGATSLIEDGS